jgi:hypothetical protein
MNDDGCRPRVGGASEQASRLPKSVGRDLDDGLIMKDELVALDRTAEIDLELEPLDEVDASRVVALEATSGALARYIARSAFRSSLSALRASALAIARPGSAHEDLLPVDDERRRRVRDALGDVDSRRVIRALEQDGELVAAEPGHGVSRSNRTAIARRPARAGDHPTRGRGGR